MAWSSLDPLEVEQSRLDQQGFQCVGHDSVSRGFAVLYWLVLAGSGPAAQSPMDLATMERMTSLVPP